MGNLFAGLSSGNQAMTYYRRGIETAGHNIANAGVEGFARQRVNVSANAPLNDGGVYVGQGVTMDSITRVRNQFLDAQYLAQLPQLGYWETRVNCIKNLEYYTGQIDYGTFQTSMDNFWTKMENLHIYPQQATAREVVLESAESMITTMRTMITQYNKYRSDLNTQVAEMVTTANGLIDDIALLCREISEAQNKGENPNDLLDKRDLLAERLCKLTGATVGSPSLDETDGAYKIDLNGKLLVQGGAQFGCDGTTIWNTRHLVLVPMVGNSNFYDVQVEGNQYDHSSNYSVASVVVERGTTDPASCSRSGVHELFVERLANGRTWTVGGAKGQLEGGERLDTIYDKNAALGIDGSFSLQVGTAGVKVASNSFAPTGGTVLTAMENAEYEFRIAGGDYETYVKLQYDKASDTWTVTTDGGDTTLHTVSGSNGALAVDDIQTALTKYANFDVKYDTATQRFEIEGANTDDMRGRLLSITDAKGDLASLLGIANKNPAVEITVTETDSLVTIANKINAAYQSTLVDGENAAYATNPPGTAPSRPEEWLHANVIQEPNGTYYIALTSNVSGEANRINVLPGSVCGLNGNFNVAKLLGFTDSGQNKTSYMQLETDPAASSTIIKGDVYVDDAYFIFNGRHYLSESNSFAEARLFKTTDGYGNVLLWNNPAADTLDRFAKGLRLNLNGLNRYYNDNGNLTGNDPTLIRVDPQIADGQIYAMLESRDDMILGLQDYLDELIYKMVTEVNAVHYSGHGDGDEEGAMTTGTAFFRHVNGMYGASGQFYLNATLKNNINLIATGSGDGKGYSRGSGDGDTAMRVAQLKSAKLFEGGTTDFNNYFLLFTADLGTQGYTANYMLNVQENVAEQIQTQRDAVMGVSTDEEMIDIVKFQQGVGAISRYMTALDDMLDRIINGMGRAGI